MNYTEMTLKSGLLASTCTSSNSDLSNGNVTFILCYAGALQCYFDYIIIHSGEWYDFLLKTLSQSQLDDKHHNNFIIRAETLEVGKENIAEAILHYDYTPTTDPKSSEYEGIKQNSIPVSTRCTENRKCRAFNCPFENYPPSYNIECIHVNKMHCSVLALPDVSELPDVQVNDKDKVFLNFGFEGVRQTSAINARNMKLPSKPLSLY